MSGVRDSTKEKLRETQEVRRGQVMKGRNRNWIGAREFRMENIS